MTDHIEKRKPGRPPGQPGVGGRPATRELLPEEERPKTHRIYCSPNEHKELLAHLAKIRAKRKPKGTQS